MINFLVNNYQWLFSGFLSGLILLFLGFIWQRNGNKKSIKQKMNIGDNSKGTQVGGDYNKKCKQ